LLNDDDVARKSHIAAGSPSKEFHLVEERPWPTSSKTFNFKLGIADSRVDQRGRRTRTLVKFVRLETGDPSS